MMVEAYGNNSKLFGFPPRALYNLFSSFPAIQPHLWGIFHKCLLSCLFQLKSSPKSKVFSSLTSADPPQVCLIFTVVHCSMPVSFPQNDYYLKNKDRNYAFYFCILYSNEYKTVLGKRQTLNISVICHMENVQMVPAQDQGRK